MPFFIPRCIQKRDVPLQAPKGTDLHLKNVCVTFQGRPVVDHINGTFEKGSLTAVVGPNGGGKSTLIKAILGLVSLSKGSMSPSLNLSKEVSYLPQNSGIDKTFPLKVRDVVSLGLCQNLGFYRSFSHKNQRRVDQALEQVGLGAYHNRSLDTLSGGQFQRVLFARISLQDKPFIFLDEPFAAIDSYTTYDLMALIQRWQEQQKTILVVSHDMDLVREFFPQTLLIVNHVLEWGPTHRVTDPKVLDTARHLFRKKEESQKHV